MIRALCRQIALAAGVLVLVGCSGGSPPTFSLSGASVDPTYTCPAGAANSHYDIHGTIDVHNGTSKAVTISAVDATLKLAAVKGGWLQKVGETYDARNITFTPGTVDAAVRATVAVTIPSACTGRSAASPVASGDYEVRFTMTTSAGKFTLESKDRHRIVTG